MWSWPPAAAGSGEPGPPGPPGPQGPQGPQGATGPGAKTAVQTSQIITSAAGADQPILPGCELDLSDGNGLYLLESAFLALRSGGVPTLSAQYQNVGGGSANTGLIGDVWFFDGSAFQGGFTNGMPSPPVNTANTIIVHVTKMVAVTAGVPHIVFMAGTSTGNPVGARLTISNGWIRATKLG